MNFFRVSTVPVPGAKFNRALLVARAAGLGRHDLQLAPLSVTALLVQPLLANLCLLSGVGSGQQVGGVVLLVGTVARAHQGFGRGRWLALKQRVATLDKGFAGAAGAQSIGHGQFSNNNGWVGNGNGTGSIRKECGAG